MFNNIGGKIKKVSEIATTVGMIASVVLGIIIMLPGDLMVLVGLLVMVLGCFFSWIGSFLLCGYGQLIENSDKLVLLHMEESGSSEPDLEERERNYKSIEADKISFNAGKCDICGKENVTIHACTIKDNLGTRYRNMCADCLEDHNINN